MSARKRHSTAVFLAAALLAFAAAGWAHVRARATSESAQRAQRDLETAGALADRIRLARRLGGGADFVTFDDSDLVRSVQSALDAAAHDGAPGVIDRVVPRQPEPTEGTSFERRRIEFRLAGVGFAEAIRVFDRLLGSARGLRLDRVAARRAPTPAEPKTAGEWSVDFVVSYVADPSRAEPATREAGL